MSFWKSCEKLALIAKRLSIRISNAEIRASCDNTRRGFGDRGVKTRFRKTPLRQSVVTVENRFVDGIAGSVD